MVLVAYMKGLCGRSGLTGGTFHGTLQQAPVKCTLVWKVK